MHINLVRCDVPVLSDDGDAKDDALQDVKQVGPDAGWEVIQFATLFLEEAQEAFLTFTVEITLLPLLFDLGD